LFYYHYTYFKQSVKLFSYIHKLFFIKSTLFEYQYA
jgi:hypothetical protein